MTADNIKFELRIKNSEGGLISAEIKDDLTEGPGSFVSVVQQREESLVVAHILTVIVRIWKG